ncbi:MAG: hypothetical protein HRT43_05120 [Campylobacteraceae bacterium]|nr:hypothetical protein [Campylobacteraceae bacterium]
MEMILNENDMVIGVSFENGTIQDYVDDSNTYGLIRIENTTANWFLFNKEDSDEILQELYKKVIKEEHFIKDEYGEEIVLFAKDGDISNEDLINKIDDYLDNEISI